MMFEWTDVNGNKHEISETVLLGLRPDCKYLLPCGMCSYDYKMGFCPLSSAHLTRKENKEDV